MPLEAQDLKDQRFEILWILQMYVSINTFPRYAQEQLECNAFFKKDGMVSLRPFFASSTFKDDLNTFHLASSSFPTWVISDKIKRSHSKTTTGYRQDQPWLIWMIYILMVYVIQILQPLVS